MNRMALIMICLVLVFSMVSCDDQGEAVGYGSLSVEVSNGDGSKTIRPTDESLAFASYRIEGRHRTIEGRTVDETFTGGSIEIDQLETGEWEFAVEGLNKDKVVLAKSEAHIVTIKTNGTAKETYTLDWIEGHGILRLSVKVQTSRVSTIECKLYDEEGNDVGTYVMTKDDSRLDDGGFLVFDHSFTDVPTGSYDATMTMKDKDNGVIGRALHPSVHIHDSLVSSYGFSWENFKNLLPNVDAPKVTNIGEGSMTVSCDSSILLGTEEDGTTIFYSIDGKAYMQYQSGIDLSKTKDLDDSLTVWTYAEKSNLNRSDVGTYTFNVEHNPDRANAVYTWNATEGGYECVATSKCKYHKSFECEAEKADVSYEVLENSTEHEEGKCRYIAVFKNEGYKKQIKSGIVPTKHRLVHHTAKSPTCTEIGWDEYDDCSDCNYATYKEISKLGHNVGCFKRGDDEYHNQVCSRCNTTVNKELHSFKDYKCEICGTWGRGPSGGYVFYDRGEYTGGEYSWRYLEVAPADLRVVNGVPTVDSTMAGYSDGTYGFHFGYYRVNSGGSNFCLDTKTGIGEGRCNTNLLVSAMGSSTYALSSGTNTTAKYAARLCKVLAYEVDGENLKDWFLPSKEELKLMYENLHKQVLGSFADSLYWSSSESGEYLAWGQYFDDGSQLSDVRSYGGRVRPVRAF